MRVLPNSACGVSRRIVPDQRRMSRIVSGIDLFKWGQASRLRQDRVAPMSIVRDEGDERQTRVDRMIDEFRKAQSRRAAAAVAAHVADGPASQPDVDTQAAVAPSTMTRRSDWK